MTLQELQQQMTQLTVQERLQLVQILIASIQQDTQDFRAANPNQPQDETTLDADLASLHPWTKSFIGILQQSLGHLEKYRFFWEWQRDLKGSSLLKAAKWQLIEVPPR